jgi:D-alanyl-D-alanine carboxypeptidase
VEHFGDREVGLVPARPVSVTVRRGQRVRTVVRAPAQVTGPLPAGARAGSVTVFRDGRRVRTVPLVTAAAVPEAGFLRRVWSAIWSPIAVLVVAGIVAALLVRRRRTDAARRRPRPARQGTG